MIIITYPTLTLVVTFYISDNISVHAMYTLKITSRYPRMYISNILILVIIDHDPILVLHTLEKKIIPVTPPPFSFLIFELGVVWGQEQNSNWIILINNTFTNYVVLLK